VQGPLPTHQHRRSPSWPEAVFFDERVNAASSRDLPQGPKTEEGIIAVLEEREHEAFAEYLKTVTLSARDMAICRLAFETGMRAVDICNLKIADIDWANDRIHITQQKTSKPLELPLRATYGNAIADYLLH
jgi:integrase